jgi:hypothetical protein
MTTTVKLEVFSRQPLDHDNAREQISALSQFEGGLLRPTRCDASEPLRELFDPEDISGPVRWLSQPGGAFFFKRTKTPKLNGYVANRKRPKIWTTDDAGASVTATSKYAEPIFATQWVAWLDGKLLKQNGPEVVTKFLVTLFNAAKGDYGYVTAEDDQKGKNFLTIETEATITTKFVGTDPEFGIPGLYWTNIFGPTITEWLGETLWSIPGKIERVNGDATLVQFGGSPETSQSSEVREQQLLAIARLGREKFFDLAEPDRRLVAPWST